MTFFGFILALAAIGSSPARRDTTLLVPPSTQVQPFAPVDTERQRMVEMEKFHGNVRDAATRSAVAGASLLTVAAMAWAMDVVVHDRASDPEDSPNRPRPVLKLAAWTAGIGAACEVFAGAAAIYSTVLSHRIGEYERRTGNRVSVQAAIVPSARAVGAVARVGF